MNTWEWRESGAQKRVSRIQMSNWQWLKYIRGATWGAALEGKSAVSSCFWKKTQWELWLWYQVPAHFQTCWARARLHQKMNVASGRQSDNPKNPHTRGELSVLYMQISERMLKMWGNVFFLTIHFFFTAMYFVLEVMSFTPGCCYASQMESKKSRNPVGGFILISSLVYSFIPKLRCCLWIMVMQHPKGQMCPSVLF